MLSESKIIALYCIVDDILMGLNHKEDIRVRVSDSEIITAAFERKTRLRSNNGGFFTVSFNSTKNYQKNKRLFLIAPCFLVLLILATLIIQYESF